MGHKLPENPLAIKWLTYSVPKFSFSSRNLSLVFPKKRNRIENLYECHKLHTKYDEGKIFILSTEPFFNALKQLLTYFRSVWLKLKVRNLNYLMIKILSNWQIFFMNIFALLYAFGIWIEIAAHDIFYNCLNLKHTQNVYKLFLLVLVFI